ncbi:uncharacterized protein LOC130120122 [Lampris incognitus]|uniref:uncharacterized protein LOC130120122 n=1 Tax=Lampris incognitus TaxID=2546036 RepID=UPI0024B51E86|nr:uncharacterized protein LOC130120122 [Lampris incognitus]
MHTCTCTCTHFTPLFLYLIIPYFLGVGPSVSAVLGLTMPQSIERQLVQFLLIWTLVLTISQVAFITFYLTTGNHGQSQRERDITPQPRAQTTDRPGKQDSGLVLGKMLTAEAAPGNTKYIEWKMKSEDESLISVGKNMTVKQYGYYFLCLLVTVQNHSRGDHKVSLSKNGKVLLQGTTSGKYSTGFLGRVEELAASDTLTVTINPAAEIDTTSSATNMGIIFLSKSSPV